MTTKLKEIYIKYNDTKLPIKSEKLENYTHVDESGNIWLKSSNDNKWICIKWVDNTLTLNICLSKPSNTKPVSLLISVKEI